MTLADYDIRVPRLADAEAVARVHVQVWQEAYAGLMPPDVLANLSVEGRTQRWRQIAEHPAAGNTTRIAVHVPTGAPVGFCTVAPSREDEPPTPLELWAINVLAAHHGTGLGQALLDVCLGEQPAHLWVVEGNRRAQAFYRRNGFAADGVRKHDDTFQVDEIRMTRQAG